ncbi:MAG: hypothetical protein ACRD4B_02310 [Acidobacteriota bacterium]
MAKPSLPKSKRKADWILTKTAFARLLEWIDRGEDSNGLRYMEIRRRLVSYFENKSCASPDELADETLLRVARRLEEEGAITIDTPAHYCYIVARFVFLESLKRPREVQLQEDYAAEVNDIDEAIANQSECLERCMQDLDPDERALIVEYYQGKESDRIPNRKALCASLRLTQNALSIRACRIRANLEHCIQECLGRDK